MKSLKKHFLEIQNSEWDYYSNFNEDNSLQIPFGTRTSHIKFIKEYFKKSGKGKVLDFIDLLPNKKLNNNRCKHTNSIFLLGILLFNKTFLRRYFFKNRNKPNYEEFPFIWFLTALFHDFGFDLERDFENLGQISTLKDLLVSLDIQNDLLKIGNQNVTPILFNNIENYFNYRLANNKLDHGIVAGIYFYDRLVKIRKNKALKNDNNHLWDIELEKQYGLGSIAVAVHNIWIPNKKSEKEYRKFNLSQLIDDYKPISVEEFPLLYILGIVDTIDPIKALHNENTTIDYILKNLLLDFDDTSITIKKKEGANLNFKNLISKVEGLDKWLKLEMIVESDTLKIEMKKPVANRVGKGDQN